MQTLRTHNSRAVASKIVSDYSRDITRLTTLNAQGKLTSAEKQELERILKAKQLISRVVNCL